MADWYGGTNDSVSRAAIHLAVWEAATDQANNRSLVSFYLDVYDNNGSYGGYGTGSWSANIAGVEFSGPLSYDFSGGQSYRVLNSSIWVPHDALGASSIYSSADFSGSSPVGYASAGGWLGLTDFAFPPGQPAAPTLTRNSTGTSIGITSAVPGSAAAITSYQYAYSTDNANWSSAIGMSGNTATFSGATATSAYYIITRAGSSEGLGAWSPSAYIAGIPTAPASIATSKTGRNVAVTCTASASNGGSAITGYFVQYSTDGGSTWSTAQAMSSQAYTYNSLPAALTYTFRVYSTNAIGSSATTASSPVFVAAGGKRWDGTTLTPTTTAKRWDGTNFVDLTTAKRWDGTNFVDLS